MAPNHIRSHSGILLKWIFNRNIRNMKFTPILQNSVSRQIHTSNNLWKIVSFNLSDIGEGIREVAIKEWFVKEGDKVEQFDNICEVQSDKASVTITSRYDGIIQKIHYKIDDVALVGKPLVDIDVENDADDGSSSDEDVDEPKPSIKKDNAGDSNSDGTIDVDDKQRVLATPAVRRIAMENKVDLSKVTATGKLGRVLKGDVLEYLNLIPAGTNKPHPTLVHQKSQVQSFKVPQPLAEDRVENLKGVRKIMFKSMTESLKIPHFVYSDEVDMTSLVSVREELKDEAKTRGIRLSFMPFCIKAASIALLKYPILNSVIDVEHESVIYKAAHNISIAMDTPEGLVVPNVKNCQAKSIFEIAIELNQLQEKGRTNQLKPEDFANGTFSLSNIGIIGGTYTHPVIMAPQVAIGAMGQTKIIPKFASNGDIIKSFVMNISWSADHRIIDGVTMARFSNIWKNYLENPNLFLLDGH